MPREDRPEIPAAATGNPSTGQTVARLAREIVELDPGSAAALRRGPQNDADADAGAAAFWKLLVKYGPARELGRNEEDGWSVLIQAIAILTPKGRRNEGPPRLSPHDPHVPMGAALHDAGVSELRLARLLTARPPMRRVLTVRLCRRLAAADQRHFDLRTLANFIRYGGDAGRRIAKEYYRAQATAGRQSQPEEN